MAVARRLIARLLIVCALATTPLALAACGGNSGIGGVIVHHVLNGVFPKHRRLISKAFCVYHVDKAFHDVTHHHAIYGAFNVYEAIKNCEAGFGSNGR
jgi:hypothetical protein